MKIPVLDKDKQPLMPCNPKRARKLMERGRAKPYWYKGIFTIILQDEPSSRYMQKVAVGIDPGSKFSGLTVKSESDTLLNIQYNAPTHVKKRVEKRFALRRSRRQRKTPYRKCRFNRKRNKGFIPPSTKVRWQQHLNLIKFCSKLYPITDVAIEDVKAKTIKGARKWNLNFSPIEQGKNWFYGEVEKSYELWKFSGFDTYQLRNEYNLKKNNKKSKKDFYTHCVDSWVLANEVIGGHIKVDNESTLYLTPFTYNKRSLQSICPMKNGIRKRCGGTVSMGIKKGTLIKHKKWGLMIIGGYSSIGITLHNVKDNKRRSRRGKPQDMGTLTTLKFYGNFE